MDYSLFIKKLYCEIKERNGYKQIPDKGFRAFAFIGVLPFIVFSFFAIIAYNVLVFLYNLISSSVDYLEAWVKKTKEDVKTPTEAIIYLCTMPYIFFNRVIMSLLSIVFFILWFAIQALSYVATLGGIRWQPYISEVKFENIKYSYDSRLETVRSVFAIVSAILFALWGIVYLAALSNSDSDGLITFVNTLEVIYIVATVVTVMIIFRKVEKELPEEVDEVCEAEVE